MRIITVELNEKLVKDFNFIDSVENEMSGVCVGYLFSKDKSKNDITQKLTIYECDEKDIEGYKIYSVQYLLQVYLDWLKNYSEDFVFANPPKKDFFKIRKDWCISYALELTRKFGTNFDENMATIYEVILELYNKGYVYVGNLGYIKIAVQNKIKTRHRDNKKKLNQIDGSAVSLETIISKSEDDGEILTVADIIGEDDKNIEQIEAKSVVEQVVEVLRRDFSEREVDQILNIRSGFLPSALYARLCKWRKIHSRTELVGDLL